MMFESIIVVSIRSLYGCNMLYFRSFSLPVYQVRLDWLPLPCIALIRLSQLSYLGSSVGRASTS